MSGHSPRPHVTVVIPTYGPGVHMRAVLRGLAAQDYSDFDVVVVDNNPREVWAPILRASDSRASVIHEPRNGLQYARNAGVHSSDSVYIAFLDDDGIPASTWLGALVSGMERYASAAAGGTVSLTFSSPAPSWLGAGERALLSELAHAEDVPVLSDDMYIVGANMCIARDAFHSAGCFDVSFDRTATSLRSSGELEFTRRLQSLGMRVSFVATAEVEHCIESRRLTETYFLSRSYWQGRSDALLEAKWGRPAAFGVRDWRSNLRTLLVRLHDWLSSPDSDARLVRKCRLAREIGYCAQYARASVTTQRRVGGV